MSERDLDRAFASLVAGVAPVTEVQRIALARSRGRVLAQPLVARRDLPPQDLAAMDGYAVCARDLADGPRALRVMGSVLAGHPYEGRLLPGTCARIMTGALMPEGADAVVMMEMAEPATPDMVALPGPLAAGLNRRVRGEHVRAGETLLPAGRRLRTTDLALACAVGEVELGVLRLLQVGVLSTGDELRDAPADLSPGCAYDSNRLMLRVAIDRVSMAGTDLGICPDDLPALEQVIESAFDQRLDALLISGGAALGDADVVRMLGGVEFVSVDIRPGRGIAVARLVRGSQKLLVLGLPGNAVAAYVLFHALALPVLARMAGANAHPPRPILLPIARDLHTRAGRIDFRRARLVLDGAGRYAVDPLPEQGSAMIRSVSDADALVAVGPAAQYRAGDLLPAYLMEVFEYPQ